MDGVILLSIIVFVIFALVRLSFPPKQDVLETHETALRLVAAVTILSLCFFICFLGGIRLLVLRVCEWKRPE